MTPSVNTFLKALGNAAKEAGKVLVGSFFGSVRKDVPISPEMASDTLLLIFQKVVEIQLGSAREPLTGDQRRRLVSVVIEQIILRSPIARGKKLRDAQKFRDDVEAFTGSVADIWNDFEPDAVETRDA